MQKKPLYSIWTLVLVSVIAAQSVYGQQPAYYIAPEGNDANPGTREKPLRSIQRAIDRVEPGETVVLLKGTYQLEKPITITAKGTADDWVTVRGEDNAKIILDGLNFNIPDSGTYPRNNGLIQVERAAHVRLRNIHVRNSRRAGINIQESHHIDVINCISENSLSPGIAAWQHCTYIRVLGNTVINANNMKMSWMPYKGHEAPHEAISMAGPHHFEVAWNHVYDCRKEGIDVKETAAHGIVHHNYVHHCDRQGLYVDAWFGALQHIEMYNNVVHDCEAGIAVSSENGSTTNHIKIHHNLVYNNRATGLFFSRWGDDNLRELVEVHNNTFYRNGWGKNFAGDPQYWLSGGCYLYSTNLRNISIRNNIFAHNFPFEIGHTARFQDGWTIAQRVNISHNLIQDINTINHPIYLHAWLKDSVYSITGTHPILADPHFENPAEGDFRLKNRSPAKDHSGNNLGAFPEGTPASFWWNGTFPPTIDVENYVAGLPKQHVPASDASISYVGRYDFTDTGAPQFMYSGCSIRTGFTGTSLAIKLTDDSLRNWFAVQIDDSLFTLEANRTDGIYQLVEGLQDTIHQVTITRRTEWHGGNTTFTGFIIDQGARLFSLPKRNRTIEFIGNSLTCGYGNEGDSRESQFEYRTENGYMAYGALVARAFNANYVAICRSGIGMYQSYGGDKDFVQPKLYDEIVTGSDARWNYHDHQPDVVVIELGANDLVEPLDSGLFVASYVDFVKNLRVHYPRTDIVCASGPILPGDSTQTFTNYIQAVQARFTQTDQNVHFFHFGIIDANGSDWHPNLEEHQQMANALLPFIKNLKNW